MLQAVWPWRRISLDVYPLFAEVVKTGLHIRRFDFANADAQVTQLRLECRWHRRSASVLPYFHATATEHIKRKNCVPGLRFPTGVRQHKARFGGFFKNRNIHAKVLAIPFERFMDIAHADANLLNSRDEHRK